MTVTVYESSDEEEYSFKTRVEASDNSQSSTQPLAKVPKENLSIPQGITPRSSRVDAPLRRRVLRDEEMHGIAKGDLSLLIRILLLSIIQTNDRVGQRFEVGTADRPTPAVLESQDLDVVRWIHGPEVCARLLLASPTSSYTQSLTVNLPQVGRSRERSVFELGVELDTRHIAHCKEAQIVLDRHKLAWGTIFELARGVTRGMWTFQDMKEHRLRKLEGSNAQSAWKVATVMADKEPSRIGAPSELWY
ncbi:uncharacterized protein EDB93DRAFT_1254831 [Suillus bovinus]|uniref:uncharacterized protein n=1 Tax=Suillus bovinus TaxID=48563 RepID=UPI001B8673D4|nr:uncharacterized protein EDB93DRAFT_1254831 [Suillus bovinus]KAG2133618.1 hypothetical protein EDB93DRAFT_1254831 [Suillus bovinus]